MAVGVTVALADEFEVGRLQLSTLHHFHAHHPLGVTKQVVRGGERGVNYVIQQCLG